MKSQCQVRKPFWTTVPSLPMLNMLHWQKTQIPWQEVADILSEYSNELSNDHQFRAQIIQAALTSFQKQCVASDSDETLLFHLRCYECSRRRGHKLMAQQSWYCTQCDIIGFLPLTPGAKLLLGIQQIVWEEGEKIGHKIWAIQDQIKCS